MDVFGVIEDGKKYKLPPTFGAFPVAHVGKYKHFVPKEWIKHGAVIISMRQSEAMWLYFRAPVTKPSAIKVGLGKLNAVSGKEWSKGVSADPQNYVVAPQQKWLDGINSGHGTVKQFVAVKMGGGLSVEAQINKSRGVFAGSKLSCLFVYLFICLFVYLFICLFVYLFICLFVYLFICLFVYLFICDQLRHFLLIPSIQVHQKIKIKILHSFYHSSQLGLTFTFFWIY